MSYCYQRSKCPGNCETCGWFNYWTEKCMLEEEGGGN
jgi:hypothetical protein